MTRTFRWNISKEKAVELINAAYMNEVKMRFKDYQQIDVDAVAELMTAESGKFGLYLCGNVGNGKTTTLTALRRVSCYLLDHHLAPSGIWMVNAVDMNEMASNKSRSNDWNVLLNYQAIAIDDLGRESALKNDYGTIISPFADLLEHRYNKMLFTAISTNMKPSDVEARYGARVADRLSEMCVKVTYKTDSYRRQ